jgi:hypothetical protein
MTISVLNWAFARSVLQRDLPDIDQAELDRAAVLAAFVPGTAGLIVPFIVEQNLTPPDDGGTDGKPPDGKATTAMPAPSGTPLTSADISKRLDADEGQIRELTAGVTTLQKSMDEVKASVAKLVGASGPSKST